MTAAGRERSAVLFPILLMSGVGWIAMTLVPQGELVCCSSLFGSLTSLMSRTPVGPLALSWLVMLVAMMLPVMAAPIRHARDRSLARRRARATTLFVTGYFVMWMLAGVLLVPMGLVLRTLAGERSDLFLLASVLVVAVWQVSPFKQTCLNRLHAHPQLGAFGAEAVLGVTRFGVVHGAWCAASCWGLMLLPMLFPGAHWLAMVAASLWVWGEQLSKPRVPSWSLRFPTKAVRLVVAQVQLQMTARTRTGVRAL